MSAHLLKRDPWSGDGWSPPSRAAQSLSAADLLRPFVYERGRGVMWVPPGEHQRMMAHLRACATDVSGMTIQEAADEWLEMTPGSAFRSSVSGHVLAAKPSNLNALERIHFGRVGGIDFLMDCENLFRWSTK